jgi:hypothetical protein
MSHKRPRQLTQEEEIAKLEAELAREQARAAGGSDADDSEVEREPEDEEAEEHAVDFRGPTHKKKKHKTAMRAPPSDDDEQEEEDENMQEHDEEQASVDYSDEDEKPQQQQHKPIKRQIVPKEPKEAKPASSSAAAAAADTTTATKKFPVSCKRDIAAGRSEVTVGERFYRAAGGPKFEVVSIPEVPSKSMRCPTKQTEPGGRVVTKLLPDWSMASFKLHGINARDTSKNIKDTTAYETFVLIGHDTLYSVSLAGGQAMLKNDCKGVQQAMKDHRVDARKCRNIIQTACDISPRGEITWLPWNLYFHMLESAPAPIAGAAAAAAASTRRKPASGSAAALAAAEVPDLLLVTAKHWIETDLEPRCRKQGGDNKVVYLDMLVENYAKMWKPTVVDGEAPPDVTSLTDAVNKLYRRNCVSTSQAKGQAPMGVPSFCVGIQMRMFCMVHPVGRQLLADLRTKFANEAMDAIKLARRGAGGGDSEDEC